MQLDAATEKFPFDINDGNYDRKMGDMDVNQTVSVPYSMAVREDAKSGFYPITYKISYKETEDGDFEEPVDKILYVRVKGEDDDDLEADAGDNESQNYRGELFHGAGGGLRRNSICSENQNEERFVGRPGQ